MPRKPKPTTASEFLSKASSLLTERGKTYDSLEGERSMQQTIDAYNAITGNELCESDGWLIMLLLKQTRQWKVEKFHRDSAEDSVTYAALLGESLSQGK